MSLGLFVEGPSDKDTIPTLIRKLGYVRAIHPRVVPQGDMLDADKMLNNIKALRRDQPRIGHILVLRDSEGVSPTETLRLTRPISAHLTRQISGLSIDYVVVDHSLEGWLACDEEALRAVLGPNARIRIRGNPENDDRPKRILKRVILANGRTFKNTADNPRIAEQVEPENIANKSPTFRHLIAILEGYSE